MEGAFEHPCRPLMSLLNLSRSESTPLSCSLADQGIKIRIRKDIRVRKRNNASDGGPPVPVPMPMPVPLPVPTGACAALLFYQVSYASDYHRPDRKHKWANAERKYHKWATTTINGLPQ